MSARFPGRLRTETRNPASPILDHVKLGLVNHRWVICLLRGYTGTIRLVFGHLVYRFIIGWNIANLPLLVSTFPDMVRNIPTLR